VISAAATFARGMTKYFFTFSFPTFQVAVIAAKIFARLAPGEFLQTLQKSIAMA
jgi:hypothetical protein